MKSGDEKNGFEKKKFFCDFSVIFQSCSRLDDFKIIPGDLGQALDQPRINPRRSLNEGRMTKIFRDFFVVDEMSISYGRYCKNQIFKVSIVEGT